MTGGGFFLKKSTINKGEHLFDPKIDMYCEDSELSLRLQKKGWDIIYAPEAIIFHNQTVKTASTYRELKKLIKITWNRFHLFSTITPPKQFCKNYHLYTIGIIKKMGHLGLSPWKKSLAYFTGGFLAVFFLLLFPFWLNRTLSQN